MSYKINDTFVGMVRDYYDEKKTMLKEEYFVNAGKKEGIYKLYDNGVLEKEINYINGLRHGICKIYHYNGKLYEESNYINDKKTGICKRYDAIGILDSEENYIDGKKMVFVNHIIIMEKYLKKHIILMTIKNFINYIMILSSQS